MPRMSSAPMPNTKPMGEIFTPGFSAANRGVSGDGGSGKSLTSGNGHLSDHYCRRRNGAAEFQIAADFRHVIQHLLQGARDGHFRYGKGQFAVANPQSYGAARII